jgi:uncharacterized membrane protein YkgB
MPTWSLRALQITSVVTTAGLVVQYIAGLLTNAYAPASGFTTNSDWWAINIHWTFGYVLGILAIILVIVAALTRRGRYVALAVVTLLGVIAAGFAGMAFVASTPNAPIYSVEMGVSFLIAFIASFLITGMTMMGGGMVRTSPSTTSTASP